MIQVTDSVKYYLLNYSKCDCKHPIKDIRSQWRVMSQLPVQVQNTEASYKMVSYDFEYCPLCRTIKSAYDRTVLADMRRVQLQELTEKRLVRFESEQRNILDSAAELSYGQNEFTNSQQAVEERGPSQPSALTFGSKCVIQNTLKQVLDRREGEDIFVPALTETGNHYSQKIVIGKLKPTFY